MCSSESARCDDFVTHSRSRSRSNGEQYAELEKKNCIITGMDAPSTNQVVCTIFERGVDAVRYSTVRKQELKICRKTDAHDIRGVVFLFSCAGYLDELREVPYLTG